MDSDNPKFHNHKDPNWRKIRYPQNAWKRAKALFALDTPTSEISEITGIPQGTISHRASIFSWYNSRAYQRTLKKLNISQEEEINLISKSAGFPSVYPTFQRLLHALTAHNKPTDPHQLMSTLINKAQKAEANRKSSEITETVSQNDHSRSQMINDSDIINSLVINTKCEGGEENPLTSGGNLGGKEVDSGVEGVDFEGIGGLIAAVESAMVAPVGERVESEWPTVGEKERAAGWEEVLPAEVVGIKQVVRVDLTEMERVKELRKAIYLENMTLMCARASQYVASLKPKEVLAAAASISKLQKIGSEVFNLRVDTDVNVVAEALKEAAKLEESGGRVIELE